MDADRFDYLSRSMSDGHSRRGIAKTVTGLALGGALGSLIDRDDAEAR